nr:HPr family phosphocarrier protein [Actinomycetota bacterium]
MPDQVVEITNDVGLHARPAAVFSKKAVGFSSE